MARTLAPEGDMGLPHADQIRTLRQDLALCQRAARLLPQIDAALAVLKVRSDWDMDDLLEQLSPDFPRSPPESDSDYLGRLRKELRPRASQNSKLQSDFEQLAKTQWAELQAPEWSAVREWILDLKGKQELLLQQILPGQECTGRLLPTLAIATEQLSSAQAELDGDPIARYRALARANTCVEIIADAWEAQARAERPPQMPPLPDNPLDHSLAKDTLRDALDSLEHWCQQQRGTLLQLKAETDGLRDQMHALENELRQRTG